MTAVEDLARSNGVWKGERHVRLAQRKDGYKVIQSYVSVDDLNAAIDADQQAQDARDRRVRAEALREAAELIFWDEVHDQPVRGYYNLVDLADAEEAGS